jgi:cob(I)alamin adenosyltransferase
MAVEVPGHPSGPADIPDDPEVAAVADAHQEIPRTFTRPPRRSVDSIVLVNTGDGKGKSSAAFGVMGRGWARGWRVGVLQFMKGGQWRAGERKLAEHLGIDWWTLGDGFTWESTDLEDSAAKNRDAWEVARSKLGSGDYDLLILDELTYVVNFGWVPVADVVAGIKDRAPKTNVVVTGRDAPPEVVELADTVTEMKLVKHAYHQGIPARRGIEY